MRWVALGALWVALSRCASAPPTVEREMTADALSAGTCWQRVARGGYEVICGRGAAAQDGNGRFLRWVSAVRVEPERLSQYSIEVVFEAPEGVPFPEELPEVELTPTDSAIDPTPWQFGEPVPRARFVRELARRGAWQRIAPTPLVLDQPARLGPFAVGLVTPYQDGIGPVLTITCATQPEGAPLEPAWVGESDGFGERSVAWLLPNGDLLVGVGLVADPRRDDSAEAWGVVRAPACAR